MREAGEEADVLEREGVGGEVIGLPITDEQRLLNVVGRVVRARFREFLDDVFYGDFATILAELNVDVIESAAVWEVVSNVRHYMHLLTDRGINLHLGPDDKDFDEEKKGEVRGAIAPALQAFLFRARKALRDVR